MARTLIALSAAFAVLSTCLIHSAHADSPFAPTETGPDTLRQRLNQAQRVALQTDKELAGYVLYIYTPKRLAEDLAGLAAYQEKSAELQPRLDELQQQIRRLQPGQFTSNEARESLQRLGEEQHNIKQELAQIRPVNSAYLSHSLYNVIHLGEDYIELRHVERVSDHRLIPLSRIVRVVLLRSEDRTEQPSPCDEPDAQ